MSRSADIKEIWIRHGGVKTLCAMVECFPYSIPEWLPDIIVFLAKFTRGNVMISVRSFSVKFPLSVNFRLSVEFEITQKFP